LDPALEKIMLTALSPKMEDRFESAQHLGQELENYIRRIGAKVGSDTLTGFMHRLFAKEIEDQENLLREYRKKQDKANLAASGREEKKEKEQKQAKPQYEEAESDLAEDVTEVKESRWNKQRWMWVVGTATVAVVAVFMLLLPSPEKSRQGASVGAGSTEAQPALKEAKPDPVLQPVKKESVRITLDVRPATANVIVDGKALKQGTREIELPADGTSHLLKFSADGYLETTEQVVADKDTKISIYLDAVPKVKKSEKPKKRGKDSSKRAPKLKRSPYG
jgi:hypothetical protein